MIASVFFGVFSLLLMASSSANLSTMEAGSSLSVERAEEVLISPSGVFSAGFHSVGDNTFCFAIWSTKSFAPTPVWMANRDQPVNGKGSKLSLVKEGNLILIDAGLTILWATNTTSASSMQLLLHDTGNLILSTLNGERVLWQSFDSPTNTLLPQQPLTRYHTLVSSQNQGSYSSGFYKLFFDNDNVLRLLYDGREVSSVYWPDPWLLNWDAGRTTFNSSKIAVFDSSGHFRSSDGLEFLSADYGLGPQRRLTLDSDGNLRLYSLDETTGNWSVTWQAMQDSCGVHGLCGANSICSHGSGAGRGCSCLPGYKRVNSKDWSYGCESQFSTNNAQEASFIPVSLVEFYGYEYDFFRNSTLESCKEKCSESSICKGFLIKFEENTYNCYPKSLLLNGKHSPNLLGTLYVRLNISERVSLYPSGPIKELRLNCSGEMSELLERSYRQKQESKILKFLVWFCFGLGCVEMFLFVLLWLILMGTPDDSNADIEGYLVLGTGFRKFTYAELKKATRCFREEKGRGGCGSVHKGVLSDGKVVAIKMLNEANQGEEEFLAEVRTIGRLNHMNLIDILGYCAEGKKRLLVYEYMENGSLAQNLISRSLDWEKRYEIAVGTAKGLAYLHEECLEWVLHCDVKPQNILLDSRYQPKVADLGLSKLVNRYGGGGNSSFSKMRGTRGYMAPEWVFNLPITSKVDVYSYGIVVLEMVTGRSAVTAISNDSDEGESVHSGLVSWVRKKMDAAGENRLLIERVIDPSVKHEFDNAKMENLVRVALQCVEEDRDARPTMSQVVDMLLCPSDYESLVTGSDKLKPRFLVKSQQSLRTVF